MLAPDLIMVLGDRYEIAAVGATAHLMGVPVAHLCGGDLTAGSADDAMRHSLTKLSHLHFVSTEEAARRVRQLGERPEQIYTVGSPGIDAIVRAAIISRAEFFRAIAFNPRPRNLLITYHPTTLTGDVREIQMDALFDALHDLGPNYGLIFTGPNVDPGGRAIFDRLKEFVASVEPTPHSPHRLAGTHTMGRLRTATLSSEIRQAATRGADPETTHCQYRRPAAWARSRRVCH